MEDVWSATAIPEIGGRMKILAIDDNKDNLTALRAVVADRLPEAQLITARNGLAGIDIALMEDPDVILLDVVMPDLDGFEVCQRLKKDDFLRDTPVIFLTAIKTDKDSRLKALNVGAEGFLAKPFDEFELMAQIRAMVKIKKANRHLQLEKEQLSLLVSERTREIQKQLAERICAEEALRESEDKFKYVFEAANVGKSITRVTGEVNCNEAFAAMLGYSRDEINGKTWKELTPEEDIERIDAILSPVIKGKKCSERFTKRYLHRNGSQVWADVSVSLRCDDSGNPLYFVTTIIDITEQRIALEERNKFFDIVDKSLNEIYIFDPETFKFKYANLGALTNLQYTLAELKNLTALDLKPDLNRESFLKMIKPLLNSEQKLIVFRTRHLRADGTLYPVEVYLQLVGLKEKQEFLAVIFDITDRLKVEAERELLITAIEQADEMIVITDLEGRILYVNSSYERVTGYSRLEVLGKNPRIVKSSKHDKSFYEKLWGTISSGKTWEGLMVNSKKNGTLYTEKSSISPVFNSDKKIVSYVAVKHDITDQLRLESQFQQAQKMESVGRLAGGVAHDYNNMLSVILGYVELALDQVKPEDPVHSYLEEILSAGNRSAEITRQLLAFARKQTISPKKLHLNETIGGMLKMLSRFIGEDIELAWLPTNCPTYVKMDPSQFDQILANLCVNARDAISGVGKITIETENVTFDDEYCEAHLGAVPGDFVMVAISDNGSGIDSETLKNIFEPFFTTKVLGRGTGLGLATVYGIVKQNNGFITVYSEPEKGTTFKIYLPKQDENGVLKQSTRVKEAPRGEGEMILLVEDEISILKLGEKILSGLGYKILSASSPGDAIRLAQKNASNIRMLITDVVMPEMNGRELATKLKSLYPGIKNLFMSGYTANIIAARGVLEEGEHFLQKPFSRVELASKVREILTS